MYFVYLARCLRMVIPELFPGAKRITSLTEKIVTKFRVWPTDIDFYMHLNNGRALTFLDAARLDMLAKLGAVNFCFKKGWMGYVSASQTRYLKQVPFLALVNVQSQIVCWDHKWVVFRHQMMVNDQLSVDTLVRIVIKDKSRTVRPAELLSELGYDSNLAPPILSSELRAFVESMSTADEIEKQSKLEKASSETP